jgi:hypothetical protein
MAEARSKTTKKEAVAVHEVHGCYGRSSRSFGSDARIRLDPQAGAGREMPTGPPRAAFSAPRSRARAAEISSTLRIINVSGEGQRLTKGESSIRPIYRSAMKHTKVPNPGRGPQPPLLFHHMQYATERAIISRKSLLPSRLDQSRSSI